MTDKHEATHTALRMCFMLAVSHPEGTPFCPCHACTYLREIRDTFVIPELDHSEIAQAFEAKDFDESDKPFEAK